MKAMFRGAKRSKTMWLSVALIVFGALGDASAYLQGLLTPKVFNATMIILGVLVAVLRVLTTKPLDEK